MRGWLILLAITIPAVPWNAMGTQLNPCRSFGQVPAPVRDSAANAKITLVVPRGFIRHSVDMPGYAESWSDSGPNNSTGHLTLLVGIPDTGYLSTPLPPSVSDTLTCATRIDGRPAEVGIYREANEDGWAYYAARVGWLAPSGQRLLVIVFATDTAVRRELIAAATTATSRLLGGR